MPLPTSVSRQDVHHRRIEMRGYLRSDGLYDIEGRITDIKADDFTPSDGRPIAAGTALHDMWVRLVVDDELLIHEAFSVTDASPHPICPDAAPDVAALRGLRISSGWKAGVTERLGGAKGCTHVRELLNAMATGAYQTLTALRQNRKIVSLGRDGRPAKLNSCYAYGTSRALVKKKWPEHFTG
jgi:hypothetical protein